MTEKFNIGGMSCAACSASVSKAVSRLEGVSRADVNLLGNSMLCEYDNHKLTTDDIVKAVEKAGFSASISGKATPAKAVSEVSFTPVRTRLIVSIILLIPLMYISMGHMIGLPLLQFMTGTENALIYAFTQLLLTIPVIYVNRKFYYVGFRALFHMSPNMDSLIAVGSTAALAYGVFSIFMIGYGLGHSDLAAVGKYASNLYFESAAMILTLVTVGKYLEEMSKNKTTTAIAALVNLAPKTATVVRDGREILVEADDIIVGDILIIKPGESIPVDGTVTDGSSAVDESALTGESMPVDKTAGSGVFSASVNKNGTLTVRADKVGKDTTLSKIIELVENAGASKAPVARLADKAAAVFVPVVMAISLVSGVVWLVAGQSFEFALSAAISVLVVSCPCALGLATPVAITVAAGRSASKGIMIKSAESLELLCKCDTVVLDKTGTVTSGTPTVTDAIPIITEKDAFLRIAAALEKPSEHPLAKAITEYAADIAPLVTKNFTAVSGRGVTAEIDGITYYGGNATYMKEVGVSTAEYENTVSSLSDDGKTVMYFANRNNLIGIIAAADEVRKTSREAVERLHSLGLKTVLLTGDNERSATEVAQKVGIDSVTANVLPQDKERAVADIQSNGNRVIMVGDGINDSPALTRADVGIAVGSGTDIAIQSADIVLMKNDITDAAEAVSFSRKTLRIIKQNLFWAFFYNCLGIPIAAGVLFPIWGIMLSPMIGAAAMSLSSIFVVTNALRLYKK